MKSSIFQKTSIVDAPMRNSTSAVYPQILNQPKKASMNKHTLTTIATAIIAVVGAVATLMPIAAQADQSTPQALESKTRAQVLSELSEAIRTGEMMGNGETGTKLNEQFPSRYPAKSAGYANTRGQVLSELAEATRTGEIMGNGETGMKLNEQFPSRYPAKPAGYANTRAQVLFELAEATRTGEIMGNGETGMKLNQLYPERYVHVIPTAAAAYITTAQNR